MGIENKKQEFPYIRYPLMMLLMFTCMEFVNWILVPMLNSAGAKLLLFSGLNYWTLRLSFDLLNSLLIFTIAVLLVCRACKINGFIVSIPLALFSFAIFFWEIGGVQCMGNCGLPLWYDIAGFIKYPIYAAISAFSANRLGQYLTSRSSADALARAA